MDQDVVRDGSKIAARQTRAWIAKVHAYRHTHSVHTHFLDEGIHRLFTWEHTSTLYTRKYRRADKCASIDLTAGIGVYAIYSHGSVTQKRTEKSERKKGQKTSKLAPQYERMYK